MINNKKRQNIIALSISVIFLLTISYYFLNSFFQGKYGFINGLSYEKEISLLKKNIKYLKQEQTYWKLKIKALDLKNNIHYEAIEYLGKKQLGLAKSNEIVIILE